MNLAVTQALAEYAGGAVEAPADAVELTLRSLVDTMGVLVAARDDEAVTILDACVGDRRDDGATVFYRGGRAAPGNAALLNGTAAHALDFDLGGMFQGHPAAVVWPAVLAAGEQVGASGREIVGAAIVAFGVAAAVAAGMDMRDHYSRWHATSTVSIFGAAAGAGRLLGLDTTQLRYALGMAASMASGSRQNFGTMTKPLHAGLAARDGLLAASLAGRGFTADPAELESPLGFFAVYAKESYPEGVIASLEAPLAVTRLGFGMKTYPCCYSAHRAIHAALQLTREASFGADDVEWARLTVEPDGYESLIHHRPTTPDEAKFSAEYTVSAALADGAIGLDTFTEEAVRRPAVQRLIERVQLEESAVPPVGPAEWPGKYYAVVRIRAAGQELVARADTVPGDHLAGLARAAIEDKFRECIRHSGTGWDADKLLAELWAFPEQARFTGLDAIQL